MPKRTQSKRDSQLQQRLQFETLLADVSARFVNVPADQLDEVIQTAQRDICRSLGVEHSSLWQVSPTKGGTFLLTHLVRDPSLKPPPREMSGTDFFPWVQSKVIRNEVLYVFDTQKVPPEATRDREAWSEYSVKSSLALPLSAGGGPVFGVLSFEAINRRREFSAHLQNRLRVLADVFANALARRQAEIKLRESEVMATLAAQAATAGLWTLDPATGAIWATDLTYQFFGMDPAEKFDLEAMLRSVNPRDRGNIRQRIHEALQTGESRSVEYRVQGPDGEARWLMSRGRRHSPNGAPPFVLMGVTADITAAKQLERDRLSLTRRLLQAQEEECARIARELHDDLGQSIALFGVQLHNALARVQARSRRATGDSLKELCAKARQLAHRVGTISHQLHSPELELLGLAGAVKALCREMSTAHDVKFDISADTTGTKTDRAMDLCLFRVLQEAVNNAIRHGNARKIKVRLRERKGDLTLSISDNGAGFNTEEPTRRRGLGLVSMAERVRLLGGEFHVVSTAGRGTKIEANVPTIRATEIESPPSRRPAKQRVARRK